MLRFFIVLGMVAGLSSSSSYAEIDLGVHSCFSEVRGCLSQWAKEHPDWVFGRQGLRSAEGYHLGLAYGVFLPALLTLEILAEPPHEGRWDGENGFDEGIRGALKGESRSVRKAADTASDVLLWGVLGGTTLLDIYLLRTEYPVLKRVLFDLSWFMNNELVNHTARVAAGRERPYVDPCHGDDDYVGSCNDGRDDNASFFSGHASTSATLAGMLCSHHLNRATTDWYDWLICGGGAATSAATGLLRITSENHNATDVIAGWASGAIFGYVLPTYFQKRYARMPAPSVEPAASPGFIGVRLSHSF